MKKEKKEKHFIKKPYYEGGISAMKNFLKSHLTYPQEAVDNKIEGTVYIRYSINNKGQVIATKIISGIGHGCEEEAIRLVQLLTFKVPKNRNLKTLFHKDIQIHFRLPKSPSKLIESPISIQYNYRPSKKKEVVLPPSSKKSGGYNIIVNF